MKKVKFIYTVLVIVAVLATLIACTPSKDIQRQLARDADKFDVYRKITIINLRTDKIVLEVEGYIALQTSDRGELAIIINNAKNEYQMHYVSITGEIVYLSQQAEPKILTPYYYEINIYAPSISVEVH